MADSQGIAVWITDKIEDDQVHHGIIKDLHDGGGLTRYGLTQKWYGAHLPAEYFTTMDNNQARGFAIQTYVNFFCKPLLVNLIQSNDIAACLVSWAVNNVPVNAIKGLQQAANVEADGHIGPQTIAAVNAAPALSLAASYRLNWLTWYRAHSDPRFLDGWIARANRVYPN